nr:hypothetical protein CFP56_09159 [Quercus suber]
MSSHDINSGQPIPGRHPQGHSAINRLLVARLVFCAAARCDYGYQNSSQSTDIQQSCSAALTDVLENVIPDGSVF